MLCTEYCPALVDMGTPPRALGPGQEIKLGPKANFWGAKFASYGQKSNDQKCKIFGRYAAGVGGKNTKMV